MRGKRVNYTYQLLNELSLSPRRGTGKGRGTRGSSLQRPPWRASFIKSASRASVSKVSRRGSRSSLASSARRRCRSSRPVRYRLKLFAQPPHPLWPPMAAVRRKGTSKHHLSQSSLDNSTATNTTANTVVTNPNSLSTDLTEEVRPLRSCLKPGTCRPCSPTHQVKAISSKCQFGGVGEGNVVSPENPLMRFSK